jgi:hypothetical protein
LRLMMMKRTGMRENSNIITPWNIKAVTSLWNLPYNGSKRKYNPVLSQASSWELKELHVRYTIGKEENKVQATPTGAIVAYFPPTTAPPASNPRKGLIMNCENETSSLQFQSILWLLKKVVFGAQVRWHRSLNMFEQKEQDIRRDFLGDVGSNSIRYWPVLTILSSGL